MIVRAGINGAVINCTPSRIRGSESTIIPINSCFLAVYIAVFFWTIIIITSRNSISITINLETQRILCSIPINVYDRIAFRSNSLFSLVCTLKVETCSNSFFSTSYLPGGSIYHIRSRTNSSIFDCNGFDKIVSITSNILFPDKHCIIGVAYCIPNGIQISSFVNLMPKLIRRCIIPLCGRITLYGNAILFICISYIDLTFVIPVIKDITKPLHFKQAVITGDVAGLDKTRGVIGCTFTVFEEYQPVAFRCDSREFYIAFNGDFRTVRENSTCCRTTWRSDVTQAFYYLPTLKVMRVICRITHINSIITIGLSARNLNRLGADNDQWRILYLKAGRSFIRYNVLLKHCRIVSNFAILSSQSGCASHSIRTNLSNSHECGFARIVRLCRPTLEDLSGRNGACTRIVEDLIDFCSSISFFDILGCNLGRTVHECNGQTGDYSLHNHVNREVIRCEFNRLCVGNSVNQSRITVIVDVNDGALAGLVHQAGCADLYADRLKRVYFRSFGIIESDVERTHVSDLICDLALDGLSVIFRIHFDDFHRRTFGEGLITKFDDDSCAVLDRGLELTGSQINNFRFFFRLFLHRQSGLGVDQRSCFRIDDVTGFRVYQRFGFAFALFALNNRLSLHRFLGGGFHLGFDASQEFLHNRTSRRFFCGCFGFFDGFGRFFGRLLCGFFRRLLGFGGFFALLGGGSVGSVVIDDRLGCFLDEGQIFILDLCRIFRFGFLCLFGRLCFRFGFLGRIFARSGFCFCFALRGSLGLCRILSCLALFGECPCFGFVCRCGFFGRFDRLSFCLLRRSCLLGFDRLRDLFGLSLCRLGCDGLLCDGCFVLTHQVFSEYGVPAASQNGEGHDEHERESENASPAGSSIQLTHTAFLSYKLTIWFNC